MEVSLLDTFFCKRVFVLHHDGEIKHGYYKVIDGQPCVSDSGWCDEWHPVNDDGTFVTPDYKVYWAISLKALVNHIQRKQQ